MVLGQRVLERLQQVVAFGGHRALLAQRQRQRSDVAVAAGERDDLGVGRRSAGRARPRRRRAEPPRRRAASRRQRLERLSRGSPATRHRRFHARHRGLVGLRDVPRLDAPESRAPPPIASGGERVGRGGILRRGHLRGRIHQLPDTRSTASWAGPNASRCALMLVFSTASGRMSASSAGIGPTAP